MLSTLRTACLTFCDSNHDCSPSVAVVTGAGSGLGLAVVQRLLEVGDTVVACDLNIAKLRDLAAEREGSAVVAIGRLVPVELDVTREERVVDMVEKMRSAYGLNHVDCVINFAGVLVAGPWCELDEKDFATTLNVNVGGTWRMNKHLLPLLLKSPSRRPRIVNVSSEVGSVRLSVALNGPYCLSKWAVEAYTYSLRQELAALDPPVHVVALTPGPFHTPLNENVGKAFKKYADVPGSKYSKWLKDSADASADYSKTHGKRPDFLAEACFQAVHQAHPSKRLSVNVTTPMRLLGCLPRGLIDYAVSWVLR